MFSRRGYVVLAESEHTAAICEHMLRTGCEHGIDVRPLPADEFSRRLPAVNHARVKSAMIFDAGGMAPHHAVMKGLRAACEERGVILRYQTTVTGIEREGERIAALLLGEERLAIDLTVIAAGTFSPDIARMAGLELEGRPWRLEACAIEPTRAALGPALAMLDRTVYMHQTARGEIVGGCEVENAWAAGATLVSDLPVITHYARHLVEMIPSLASQRILRQWAGHIHATADFAPLLGPHPDCRDLWVTAGWSYGIAGAAGAGDLLAKAIVTGEIDSRMAPFAVDRKRRGKLIKEGAIVITE
jgi:sarcosine oxidase subunit beta